MMMPLLPLLLQILFLVLVTSNGRYLVILGERRSARWISNVSTWNGEFATSDSLHKQLDITMS